ncbi:MAG: glycosyltransferase [Deltaproteobacteria bacterium]|jgi:glycosyltransferase involved in cell wall biosynthesis|nr:glycosyltransferase [Deltaproteobacteria bacterium]
MVSIIIPAHEEEKYIGASIERLLGQKGIVFIKKNENRADFGGTETEGKTVCELTVVVTHGEDDTEGAVSKYADRGVNLISDNFSGVSEARNIGASVSRGDVFLFLDADTLLNDGFIKRLDDFKDKRDFIGTSRLLPDINTAKARIFMFGNNIAHIISKTSMALIFCHKDVYKKVGGFDERMQAGEDLKFINIALKNKFGKFKYLGGISAVTSMRRFEINGYFKTAMEWMGGYFFKPPEHYDVVR